MIRYLCLTLAALAMALQSHAQQLADNYSFAASSSTYSAISGGTVVASGTGLDEQRYLVSLPFTFSMNGTNYTQAYICVNGYLAFGADPGTGVTHVIASTATGFSAAAGFATNLASLNSTTELMTQTSGSSPNRTFTIQWKNFGYPSSTALTTNFQIKLKEATHAIEVTYGAVTLTGSTSQIAVQAGVRGTNNAYFTARGGLWSSSSSATSNTDNFASTPTHLPASGQTFLFSPPLCATPANQPTNIAFSPNSSSINVSWTAAVPAVQKYLVVRTPNVALSATPVNGTTYSVGGTLGNGTIVYAGSSTSFTNSSLSGSTYYTYTVFAYNDFCAGGPLYKTTAPISGTSRTTGPDRYTWIATSGTGDFNTASNWSPSRTSTFTTDTLVFANGGTPTVTNVPNQSLAIIKAENSTAVNLVSSGTAALTVNSLFSIEAGSSVALNNALTLKYSSGSGKTGAIGGKLYLGGTSIYDANNSMTTITGSVVDSGANAEFKTTCTTCSDIIFEAGSTYEHARNGGVIPRAFYNPSSTVKITGTTNTAPTHPTDQTFGNYTWACVGQTAGITAFSSIDTIKGNLSIVNTNTYTLRLNTSSTIVVEGDFVQTAGTYQVGYPYSFIVLGNAFFNGGVIEFISNGIIVFYKNFVQRSGHLFTRSNTSISGKFSFSGNTNQAVSVAGTDMLEPDYSLVNGAGATLSGTLKVGAGRTNDVRWGNWTGNGSFSYHPYGRLLYGGFMNQKTTEVEWPAVNGPQYLDFETNGNAPDNRLYLHAPRKINGALSIVKGVFVLGPNNLTIDTNCLVNVPIGNDQTAMIAADSTGQLIKYVAPGSGYFNFPVGDITGDAEYTPANISWATNSIARYVGIRVIDKKHVSNTTTNNTISRYWSFTDNGGSAPYTYTAQFMHTAADLAGSTDYRLKRWNGSTWQQLPSYSYIYTFFTPDRYFVMTPSNVGISSATYPLGGSDFTAMPSASNTYVWTNAASDKNYQNPNNWNPVRTVPDPADRLVFNSGNRDTVSNIGNDIISRITFTNYTTAVFSAAPATTAKKILSIGGDNDPVTLEMAIDSGSALYVTGTVAPLEINFTPGTNSYIISTAKAEIAGRLEIENAVTGVENGIRFPGCVGVVKKSGWLAAGFNYDYSSGYGAIFCDLTSLKVFGTYEHKYTINNGSLPRATWEDGSLVLINSITTSNNVATFNFRPSVYDLTYNCPNQTSTLQWYGAFPNVRGTAKIISTGTGSMVFTSTSSTSGGYMHDINNFEQTGGTINFSSVGSGFENVTLNIAGYFLQTGGTFFNTSNASGNPVLNFNGTSGRQQVSFLNAAPAGRLTYRISNPAGINLDGTGTLTGTFNINTNCRVQVSSAATYPIISALKLAYASNAVLVYDAKANCVSDTVVYPVQSGPANLTVDMGAGNAVTLPGSRTIGSTLAMISGDIDITDDTLTIGTSTGATGSISYTAGSVRMTTGMLRRWYSSSGLPTNPGTGVGFYPIGYNGQSRNVSLYFSTSVALSPGGVIGVSYNHVDGITTGLSVADGFFTISNRTNASWKFYTFGSIALASASIGVRITGGDMFGSNMPANLRLMKTTSTVGSHIAGSGTYPNLMAQRGTLSIADLTTGNFHIGSDNNSLSPIFISVTDGKWKDGSTWNRGIAPTPDAYVVVRAGDTVVSDTTTAVIRSLTVKTGGSLFVTDSTFAVDSNIMVDGTFAFSKGTVNLYYTYTQGGKSPFAVNGTLTVSGGRMNIGGYLNIASTATFNQSGGDIYIDGNMSSISANSVPNGTHLFSFAAASSNVTGGSIIIVDPPVGSSSYAVSVPSGVNASFGAAHNLIIGDGISLQSTSSFGGFFINMPTATAAPYMRFGSLTIKGSASGSNRRATQMGYMYLNGNLSLENTNAYYAMATRVYVKGNITAAAGTTMNTSGEIHFAENSVTPATSPQTVSGAGRFEAITTITDDNFGTLSINNSSSSGVTMNIGNVYYTNKLLFVKGLLNMGSNVLTRNATSSGSVYTASQSTGWVVGKFQQQPNASAIVFPIGDASSFAPIAMTIPTGITTGAGYVRAATISGDHSAIVSSIIQPAKSINRQYIIDGIAPGTFTGDGVTMTLNWQPADADAGITSQLLNAQRYTGTTWADLNITENTATSVSISGLGTQLEGTYQVGQAELAPVIVQQPVSGSVCIGDDIIFSVSANYVNGYQWQVLTGGVWTNIANIAPYMDATSAKLHIVTPAVTMNGTQYRCRVYNGFDTTNTNAVTLSVGTTAPPSVSIATASTTVCAGAAVIFTATPVNGGSTPSYQWKKNNVNIGANSATYTTSTLVTGDIITCVMTSSLGCASPATANSNSITITVNPTTPPAVTITANPGNTVCTGTNVNFTAAATNAGLSPTYQWKKNGLPVGTNSATYASNTLVTSDAITCEVTSSNTCASTPTVASTAITMTVNSFVTPSVSIAAAPGNVICAGTSVTFTATPTNGGTTPAYQWQVNNVNAGTNSNTYTTTTLAQGDVVKCILTSSDACATVATATSSNITMTVTPTVLPAISVVAAPSNTVCAGTSVTFTATPTNGGTTPTYQWKVNNVNAGTNSNTFTSTTLANNDIVTCQLTSNAGCATPATVTSTGITMTVNPVVTPSVSITVLNSMVCAGTSVTFTATPTNGGTTPSYQWKVNNVNVGTNSATYTSTTLANNDVVACVLTTNATCASTSTATSNSITMIVMPNVALTASISASPGNTICDGTQVFFTATTNSGWASYDWKLNGVSAGVNSATVVSSTLQNGNTISCTITDISGACMTSTTANSNVITMVVNPIVTPTVIVVPGTTGTVCAGVPVTFTAHVTHGGTAPVFSWELNGNPAGTNSSTFTTTLTPPMNNIQCIVTSNVACATTPTAWGGLGVTTNPSVTPAVTITANPGVHVGPYTPVTFTANPTNGGVVPLYQWLKNGVGIPGQTGSTYTGILSVDFNAGDKISVRLTSDEECALPAIVTSNELTMQVNVGVGEQNNLGDLTLSPNPNTGKFRLKGLLKGTAPDNNVQVSITNMLGQVVYTISMPVTGNEVDLMVEMPAHFTDGTYMLRVTRGESVYTSRFILQRF